VTVEQAIALLSLIQDKSEPVFVLRGQDVLAPGAIRHWCELAKEYGVSEGKVWGAREVRGACLKWKPRKLPD